MINNLGPLDWRIPIVTPEGRPTQEFQRRWANQISNNSQIGSITIGSGPPPGTPAPADGAQYADTSTNPYTLYIGGGGVWNVAGSSGANPTATAGDVAINGSANTYMRSDAAPAVQKASSSQFGIVKVDGTTITETGGVISAVGGGGGAAWNLALDTSITVATPNIDLINLDVAEALVLFFGVTTSLSGFRSVWLSTNNGASFYNTSGDYETVSTTGTGTATSSIGSHATASSANRTSIVHILNMNTTGGRKIGFSNGFNWRLFLASQAKVNAIRLGSTAGDLTGGSIQVWTR